MTKVNPIPEGYHTVTPHLTVKGAAEAIAFYEKAFGAEEIERTAGPEGRLMHASLQIGTSRVMLNDEFPQMGVTGPAPGTPSPVTLHLYVEDVDLVFARAVAAGAQATMPPQDMFWGDRYATVTDPFGHSWSIGAHREDLTPEEIDERAAKAFDKGC